MIYFIPDWMVYGVAGIIILLLLFIGAVFLLARNYVICRIKQRFFGSEMASVTHPDNSHEFSNYDKKIDWLVGHGRQHRIGPGGHVRSADGGFYLVHSKLGQTYDPDLLEAVNRLQRAGYINFAHVIQTYWTKYKAEAWNNTVGIALANKNSDNIAVMREAFHKFLQEVGIDLLLPPEKADNFTLNASQVYKFTGQMNDAYLNSQISEEEKLLVQKKDAQGFIEKHLWHFVVLILTAAVAVVIINSISPHTTQVINNIATTTTTLLGQ